MAWVLGLDFGTSNTAAAIWDGVRAPQVVRLSPDTDQMPSGVWLDDAGRVVTGQAGARGAVAAPERYERSPKARIGEPSVLLGDRDLPVTDLVAAVLSSAATAARRHAGGAVPSTTVLTHPAQWGSARLQVLREAAQRAGLGPVELLPEPVAAASWYLHQDDRGVPVGSSIGVFDFGGGTCDVAILTAGPHGLEIAACDGEDWLGGEHLDQRLVDEMLRRLRQQGDTALAELVEADESAYLALREQVRGAKHILSEYESAQVVVRAGTTTTTILLTRPEFDAVIGPDVERAVELVRRLVQSTGGGPDRLARFYLTGGSSAILLVQRRLHELLGRPVATLSDPKTVVALGATQQAPRPYVAPPPPPATPSVPFPAPPNSIPAGSIPAGPMPGPTPPRKSRKVLAAVGIVAALALVGGGIAFGVSQAGGGDDPSGSGTSTTSEPPGGSDGPEVPEVPPGGGTSPATPPADLAAVFPDLEADGVTCSELDPEPGTFEILDGLGTQPVVLFGCEYDSFPTVSVYYAKWGAPGQAAQWVTELRNSFPALDGSTMWAVGGGPDRGPYMAGTFTGNVQQHGAYSVLPYSFSIVAATFEEANAAFVNLQHGPLN